MKREYSQSINLSVKFVSLGYVTSSLSVRRMKMFRVKIIHFPFYVKQELCSLVKAAFLGDAVLHNDRHRKNFIINM